MDIPSVVSKYLGETEKNMRSLFDRVEAAAGILLFDDADALFERRADPCESALAQVRAELEALKAEIVKREVTLKALLLEVERLRAQVEEARDDRGASESLEQILKALAKAADTLNEICNAVDHLS
jgi:predicted  nucleic acid-binding Zn-ribbon protein